MVPHSIMGKIVGGVCSLSGVLVIALVLVVDSTEVGDNNGNRKRYDKHTTERAYTPNYLTHYSMGYHVTISEKKGTYITTTDRCTVTPQLSYPI